jgi:ABC-2 type transport system ATP-binding protein
VTVKRESNEVIEVTGLSSDVIGDLAARKRIALHELTPMGASLEEAFMQLTSDSVEYHAAGTTA